MIHLGLIGYPLGHSLSPRIHKAALAACELEGEYSLFPIHPDNREGLTNLLSWVRMGDIAGLNVTIPHKQNVIQFLDELTSTARSIGAVNTIYLQDDKLIGDNTDAAGFLADLKKFVNEDTSRQVNRNTLVLGAGGSARAVSYALLNDGWNVTILARRFEQAQRLANAVANFQLQVTTFNDLRPSTFDLIVNTTPVGMSPNIDQSPWPEKLSFPPRAVIYDLIYNPRETKLVGDARAQGIQATTGLGMLIEQAALGFELWTGIKLSGEIFRSAVE